MTLTIKVISYQERLLDSPLSAAFKEEGGTVGRSPDCHLVLADDEKVVSTIHGLVEYENGIYYYTDNSLNGTQNINRNQLLHHEKTQVNDGDQLQIGDYVLQFYIEDGASELLTVSNQKTEQLEIADNPQQTMPLPVQPSLNAMSDFTFDQNRRLNTDMDTDLDPEVGTGHFFDSADDFFDTAKQDESIEYPSFSSVENFGDDIPVNASFTPPKSLDITDSTGPKLPESLSLDDFFGEEENVKIPNSKDAYNDLKNDTAPPLKSPSSPPPATSNVEILKNHLNFETAAPLPNRRRKANPATVAPTPLRPYPQNRSRLAEKKKDSLPPPDDRPTQKAAWLDIFFESAGLKNGKELSENEAEDLMRLVGTVLREFAAGMITIMRGRTELKSQLRVAMTTFKPAENNPLKFSPTVETVLKYFLLDRDPGFLDAVESIREGFSDIKNHELAINAGVQVSLLNTLKQFDPKLFEKKIEDKFVLLKKARCWHEYRTMYHKTVENALNDFFGPEFVRAYEEQMEKLRPVHKLELERKR